MNFLPMPSLAMVSSKKITVQLVLLCKPHQICQTLRATLLSTSTRGQTMQSLQHSLLVGALEKARFGVCIVDASARLVYLNSAFSEKIGVEAEHVLGQSYDALRNRIGHTPEFDALFGPAQGSDAEELSVECTTLDRHGTTQYLLLQSSNFSHESGEVFRIVSAINVTDYGVTRDRFIELHRQMDAMNNAVVIVDAREPDMPITYVNAHFERMTGYTRAEAIGRNCRFLQGDVRDQAARAALRAAIDSSENCHVTLRNFRKDGTEFINELFISPVIDAHGVVTHFIGVQHEASARSFSTAKA
jgi:PAS domain S-box-containing protein